MRRVQPALLAVLRMWEITVVFQSMLSEDWMAGMMAAGAARKRGTHSLRTRACCSRHNGHAAPQRAGHSAAASSLTKDGKRCEESGHGHEPVGGHLGAADAPDPQAGGTALVVNCREDKNSLGETHAVSGPAGMKRTWDIERPLVLVEWPRGGHFPKIIDAWLNKDSAPLQAKKAVVRWS